MTDIFRISAVSYAVLSLCFTVTHNAEDTVVLLDAPATVTKTEQFQYRIIFCIVRDSELHPSLH